MTLRFLLCICALALQSGSALACDESLALGIAAAVGRSLDWLVGTPAAVTGLHVFPDGAALRRDAHLEANEAVTGLFLPGDGSMRVACRDRGQYVFEVVLRHEVAHYYLYRAYGVLPRWLDEGLAACLEVAPVPDSQGIPVNPDRLREFRSMLMRGQVPPLADFVRQSGPLNQDGYAMAWALVFALLQHPEPAVQAKRRQVLKHLLRFPGTARDWPTILTLLGEGEDWEARWRREIWALPTGR